MTAGFQELRHCSGWKPRLEQWFHGYWLELGRLDPLIEPLFAPPGESPGAFSGKFRFDDRWQVCQNDAEVCLSVAFLFG